MDLPRLAGILLLATLAAAAYLLAVVLVDLGAVNFMTIHRSHHARATFRTVTRDDR